MQRLLLVSAAAATLAFTTSARAADLAGTALNIIPSGQPGGLPAPAGADEQMKMYDALTPLFDNVTAGDLTKTFKPAGFGATDCPCTPEPTPRAGVTITRDRFSVPHIVGVTADDVTWATGWVTAEDRALLLGQGRYAARFAALDAPGINAFDLVKGLKAVTVTKQADALITKEGDAALKAAGAEGKALLHDTDVYIQGVNARLKQEGSASKPWTRADVYSVNALAGQIFGQGGGDEARRSMLYDALTKKLGKTKGRRAFDDLSAHMDADTPTTISTSFPYEAVPAKAGKGNAIITNGSLRTAALRNAAASTRAQHYASNFLMVGKQHSANGHPLFVAGPQIGYYYPGLTLEMDLQGPGYQARGAAIPAGVGNILIGRGPDFAWSLTSAGSDTNDQFVETLCRDSTHYVNKGRCIAMKTVEAGKIGKQTVKFRTTVHGPVLGYAKSSGKRVAISFMRSSHGRDMSWQLMFKRFTRNGVTNPQTFFAAAALSAFTFNVAYADDQHIATYSAGRLPVRPPSVDPRLPTKGTGQYEWKGFLAASKHPQQVDPPSGYLVNWNNKPAPGFGAADDEYSYGATHRVQMLNANLAKRPTHDLASVVGAMNAAATQDLRVTGPFFDALTGILDGGTAPSPRDQQMVDLLKAWRTAGASRLDRDGDGKMDAGGAPLIVDTLYPLVSQAAIEPLLGSSTTKLLTQLTGTTNGTGSGFTGGRLALLDKDLAQRKGRTFKSPLRTAFCGKGDLSACRTALWKAVDAAGNAIAAKQGADPAAWTSDANAERITFSPVGAIGPIRYTNRPSGIQQVMSFSGHR